MFDILFLRITSSLFLTPMLLSRKCDVLKFVLNDLNLQYIPEGGELKRVFVVEFPFRFIFYILIFRIEQLGNKN